MTHIRTFEPPRPLPDFGYLFMSRVALTTELPDGGESWRCTERYVTSIHTLNDYVFLSRNDYMAHMSTRQYARLVREWVISIGLPPQDYGTHSLRRTKASMIYKATGNLRAVRILFGHAKIDSTVRYPGVDVEDALELAERTEV